MNEYKITVNNKIENIVDNLKSHCDRNFYNESAHTILHVVMGSFSSSDILWNVQPKDLMKLESKEFINLLSLLSFLYKNKGVTAEYLFTTEWLEDKLVLLP